MAGIRVRHLLAPALAAMIVSAVLVPAPALAATGTLTVDLSFGSAITATAEVYVYPADHADWIDVPSGDDLLATSTVNVVDGQPAHPATFALKAGTYRVCLSLDVNVDYTGEPDSLACVGSSAHLPAEGDDVVVTDGGTTTVSLGTGAIRVDVSLPAGQHFDPSDVVHTYRFAGGQWEFAYARRVGAVAGTHAIVDLGGVAPGAYRVCWNPQWAHQGWPVAHECWPESLSPDDGADINVAAGQTVTGIALTPNLKPVLRGHFDLDSGTQALYVDVVTYRRVDGQWAESGSVIGQPAGSRDFGALVDLPGSYRLCLRNSEVVLPTFVFFQCWRADGQPAYRVSDATTVEVADWGVEVVGLDIDIRPRGISGLVRGIYTAARGNALVTLYQRGPDGTWSVVRTRRAGRSGDGPYAFDYLATGDYRVCVHHQNPEFVPGFAPECVGGPTLTSAATIHYLAGTAVQADDVVLDQGSGITGTVAGGDAVVPVNLYTEDGRPVASTVTDGAGGYSFGPLPFGRYRLAFNRTQTPWGPESWSRRAAEWWDDIGEQRGITRAKVIDIATPSSVVADARLTNGGSITGHFPGAGSRCRINAVPAAGDVSWRRARTTAGGAFDVGGLATGTYNIGLAGSSCPAAGERARYLDADSLTGWTTRRSDADMIRVTRGQVTVLA